MPALKMCSSCARVDSRVLIVPAWAPTHPSPDVLKRILATRVYPKPRDIFVTMLRQATKDTIGARANAGGVGPWHVVVRSSWAAIVTG
jgi:hypothetical protein